jgi:hypothetical protein
MTTLRSLRHRDSAPPLPEPPAMRGRNPSFAIQQSAAYPQELQHWTRSTNLKRFRPD